MTGHDRPERRPAGVGTQEQDNPPVGGTVVVLADPEAVATDLIECKGPAYARSVAACIYMLAAEVGR